MIRINNPVTTTTHPTHFKKWHLNQQLVLDIEYILPGQLVGFFSDAQSEVMYTMVRVNEDGKFVCDVPNILLTRDYNIYITIDIDPADYPIDIVALGFATHFEQIFQVDDARKPEGYVYTETQVVRKDSNTHFGYPTVFRRFKCDTGTVGDSMHMEDNDKVTKAPSGAAPVGVMHSMANDHALIQIAGEVEVKYSGSAAPSLGLNRIVCNGSGGMRVAASGENGRNCWVIRLNTIEKTMRIIMM